MNLGSLLAAGLLVGYVADKCAMCQRDGGGKITKLVAPAQVSRETAQQAALVKVSGGTVKAGELEMDHGQWIWSFAIVLPDSKAIKQVAVDAITGDVISVVTERPESVAGLLHSAYEN